LGQVAMVVLGPIYQLEHIVLWGKPAGCSGRRYLQ